MLRREFVLCVGTLSALSPRGVGAQIAPRIRRVAFLGNSTAALEANLTEPFREGLRDLGYVEGRTILIYYRWAEGDYSRFPALVAELLALDPDVIVTAGTPAALAVARATSAIPCVMVAVGDPVGTGLIASLAAPGRNLTGITSIAPELEGKRLSLLREFVPTLTRVAVFWNPDNPFHTMSKQQVQDGANALNVEVQFVPVRTSVDMDAALSAVERAHAEGLIVLPDRVFLHDRTRLMSFATEHRLPGIYAYRELVEAGGLMSYGPSYAELHRRAALFVDKLLKGANAAELPVEQPTKFELVVNLKAAFVLGLTPPPTLVARADEVIE